MAAAVLVCFAGSVSADLYNHVSIDISSLPVGSEIELDIQLFDWNFILGDTWALVDNVNLGPGDEAVNFEDGTLQGFADLLNPASITPILGNLSGGSYLMRIDEDLDFFPTEDLWRTYSNLGSLFFNRGEWNNAEAAFLKAVQLKASEEGIPYQTLVSSIIHKYISGSLRDVSANKRMQSDAAKPRR